MWIPLEGEKPWGAPGCRQGRGTEAVATVPQAHPVCSTLGMPHISPINSCLCCVCQASRETEVALGPQPGPGHLLLSQAGTTQHPHKFLVSALGLSLQGLQPAGPI